jgi:hypothetical protein
MDHYDWLIHSLRQQSSGTSILQKPLVSWADYSIIID